MADIIAFSQDDLLFRDLELEAREQKIRCKYVATLDLVEEWCFLRSFGALVVDVRLSPGVITRAIQVVRDANPQSILFGYAVDPLLSEERKALLDLGLDIVEDEEGLFQVLAMVGVQKEPGLSSLLLVEDLDTPREIVAMYLEYMGYKVIGVDSASEAIEEIERHPMRYSCVITDIRMPEMDGVALIRYLRENRITEDIPIIALSAYGTAEQIIDCLDAGVSGFLTKPPKKNDIVRELGRARRIATGMEVARLAESDQLPVVRKMLIEKGFLKE